LQKGQVWRVTLQAPERSTLLSLYPPTSKAPALLSDATEVSWTGTLTATGFYEIVVVSIASQPIRYSIDLAAADNITSPSPSPSSSPSPSAALSPSPTPTETP